MFIPIDKNAFSKFIEDSKIFDKTDELLNECLKNWYNDDSEQFKEDMRADLNTVMEQYKFYNSKVSFDKNFDFTPPLDTISCIIAINDEEDDYCITYRAVFDYELNVLDDATYK